MTSSTTSPTPSVRFNEESDTATPILEFSSSEADPHPSSTPLTSFHLDQELASSSTGLASSNSTTTLASSSTSESTNFSPKVRTSRPDPILPTFSEVVTLSPDPIGPSSRLDSILPSSSEVHTSRPDLLLPSSSEVPTSRPDSILPKSSEVPTSSPDLLLPSSTDPFQSQLLGKGLNAEIRVDRSFLNLINFNSQLNQPAISPIPNSPQFWFLGNFFSFNNPTFLPELQPSLPNSLNLLSSSFAASSSTTLEARLGTSIPKPEVHSSFGETGTSASTNPAHESVGLGQNADPATGSGSSFSIDSSSSGTSSTTSRTSGTSATSASSSSFETASDSSAPSSSVPVHLDSENPVLLARGLNFPQSSKRF